MADKVEDKGVTVSPEIRPELESTSPSSSFWSDANVDRLVASAKAGEKAVAEDDESDADGDEGDEEEDSLRDAEEEAEESEHESEDAEDDEDDEDADAKADSKAAEKEEAKVYKARLQDGSTLEIPDNAVFKLKENGRYRKITFKELKKDHAGQTAWEEKLEEVNTKTQAVEERARKQEHELRSVNQFVGKMVDAAKKGEVYTAIGMLGELCGEEPSQFLDAWMGAFDNFYGEFLKLSPAERQEFQLRQKNLALERKLNEKRGVDNRAKQYEETTRLLNEARQKHEISDSELKAAYESFKDKEGKQQSVGLEGVVTRVLDMRVLANVDLVDEELATKLNEDEKMHVWRLVKAAEANGEALDVEDYAELIQTVVKRRAEADEESTKRLSRKVRKNRGATPKGREEKKKKTSVLEGAKSLDDMWGRI